MAFKVLAEISIVASLGVCALPIVVEISLVLHPRVCVIIGGGIRYRSRYRTIAVLNHALPYASPRKQRGHVSTTIVTRRVSEYPAFGPGGSSGSYRS